MKTQYDVLNENPEFRRLLAIESLVAESAEAISRLMSTQGISRAELARRIGKSRAWVTQMLSGKANLTIRTLAEVVHALDGRVQIDAVPAGHTQTENAVRTTQVVFTGFQLSPAPVPRFRLAVPQLRQTEDHSGPAGKNREDYAA